MDGTQITPMPAAIESSNRADLIGFFKYQISTCLNTENVNQKILLNLRC
jgi:hypothetical protein